MRCIKKRKVIYSASKDVAVGNGGWEKDFYFAL